MDRNSTYVDYHKMLVLSVVASMPYVHKLNEAHDSFIYIDICMYLWSFLKTVTQQTLDRENIELILIIKRSAQNGLL